MEPDVLNHCSDTPWTWRDRWRFRLFPAQLCPLPDAPATFEDVLVSRTVVCLSALDFLRVLLTGHLLVETRTVTEHKVGDTRSASVAYPILRPR